MQMTYVDNPKLFSIIKNQNNIVKQINANSYVLYWNQITIIQMEISDIDEDCIPFNKLICCLLIY